MTELVARLLEREAVLLHRIEVLQAEVKAWRKASARCDGSTHQDALDAEERTDASGALTRAKEAK